MNLIILFHLIGWNFILATKDLPAQSFHPLIQSDDTVKLKHGSVLYSLSSVDSCLAIASDTVIAVVKYEDQYMVETRCGLTRIVYGSLKSSYVKKGQVILKNQLIGHLSEDYFEKEYFHSEVYISDRKGRIDCY